VNQLTEEQQAVVDCRDRIVCVAAVPGSGKTTTVCAMVNQWMGENSGKKAVVITFTTASAGDIRKRIGNSGVHFIGTGHAFFLKVLKEFGHLIGLSRELSVITPEMATIIMRETAVLFKADIPNTKLFEEAKKGEFLTAVKSEDPDLTPKRLVAMAYHRRIVSEGLIDYDSIITFGRHLFEVHRPVDVELLVVDEAQDLSDRDWAAYRAIKPGRAVFVGDPDQSIYEWRGASPKFFLAVCNKPTTTLKALTMNFRFGPRIAFVANKLIVHNKERVPNSIVTHELTENKIYVEHPVDTNEEVSMALAWAKKNPTNSAIICRWNATVQSIRAALKDNNVRTIGGVASRPPDWANAMARLGILANPYAKEIAYQQAVVEFGKEKANLLRLESTKTNTPLAYLCPGFYPKDLLENPPDAEEIMSVAIGLLEEQAGISRETLSMIDEIVGTLADTSSVDELLLAMAETQPQHNGEGVMVSTIHRVKGLEFDHIFLPSWTQKDFPRVRSEGIVEEEERRLAYVALTRARKTVSISAPLNVEGRVREQSVFLTEMLG